MIGNKKCEVRLRMQQNKAKLTGLYPVGFTKTPKIAGMLQV